MNLNHQNLYKIILQTIENQTITACLFYLSVGTLGGTVIYDDMYLQTTLLKLKKQSMKRIIPIAFAAVLLGACADTERDNSTIDSDTQTTTTTTTTQTTYTPSEGDVTYRENKVKVMKNGEWVDADKDVTLDNGVVVYRTGKVKRDNKEIELEDGEVVNRSGDFFDRSGRAIENAWEDTKEGVKKAGKEIEKGTKKAGEKVEDAVDDDDNK